MAISHTSTQPVEILFQVVMNAEGQYSIWPADRDAPHGWSLAGFSGRKEDCLAFVEEVWKDMRPASLREAMVGPV